MPSKKPTLTTRVKNIEARLKGADFIDPSTSIAHRLLMLEDRMGDAELDRDAIHDRLRERHAVPTLHAKRVEHVESEVARIIEGLGGVLWKDVRGRKRWIATLSTGHLQSIMDGGFAKREDTRHMIQSELERRRIDADYRRATKEAQLGKPTGLGGGPMMEAARKLYDDRTRGLVMGIDWAKGFGCIHDELTFERETPEDRERRLKEMVRDRAELDADIAREQGFISQDVFPDCPVKRREMDRQAGEALRNRRMADAIEKGLPFRDRVSIAWAILRNK